MIAVANVVVLEVGRLTGADLRVDLTPGAAAIQVGVGSVLLMSLVPTIFGGLALRLAARRGARAWRAVGWLGLALGALTVPLPFSVGASSGTSLTLASMHLVAGLVWFGAVRRAAAQEYQRSTRLPRTALGDPGARAGVPGGQPADGDRA